MFLHSTFLESFRADHREAVDNLERVQARVDEVLERKRAAEDGIAAARAACEQIKGFTKGEAARLSREFSCRMSLQAVSDQSSLILNAYRREAQSRGCTSVVAHQQLAAGACTGARPCDRRQISTWAPVEHPICDYRLESLCEGPTRHACVHHCWLARGYTIWRSYV